MLTTLARQRVVSGLTHNARRTQFFAFARHASTDSHSDHHGHQQDSVVYPEESFNTPFWRGAAVTAVIGFGLYHILPLLDEDGNYLTRLIQLYKTSPEVWNKISSKHLEQTISAAEDQLTTASALRPVIYRLRHPASMEYASTRNVPIGADNILKDVVIKRDDSWS